MRLQFLITFLLFLCIHREVVGQQVYSREKLREGLFSDTVEISNTKKVFKGENLITTSNDYEIAEKSKIFFRAWYKKLKQIVIPDQIVNDSFSVKHGWLEIFNIAGNLQSKTLYDKGIYLSSRDYKDGNIIYFDSINYIDGTGVELSFYNDILFKRKISNYLKHLHQIVYYPENDLHMSNAEFTFEVDFLNKRFDSKNITLTSKRKLRIDSIVSSSGSIKYLNPENKNLQFPLIIVPNKKSVLKLMYYPTPITFCEYDTLKFYVNDSCHSIYYGFTQNLGYHLNYRTVEKTKMIELSKWRDHFLILPPMGTVTNASITCPDRSVKNYNINKITKIDLRDFEPGVYYLDILSCNHGGTVKLSLKK